MFLKEFYSIDEDGSVVITAQQASLFAKEVAKDFNPLHDPDAKRFCVPGDLLFSLVLEKYGLSEKMYFTFAGMVGDAVKLNFPETNASQIDIKDNNGKTYLQIERRGGVDQNEEMIETLVRDYVAFSGHNFPYVLVPLLEKENVMFSLDRPLVIYENMNIEFKRLNFNNPRLEMLKPELEVNGKRGSARLRFQIISDDEVVGSGSKKLTISGLRPLEAEPLKEFVNNYLARKEQYLNSIT